MLPTPTAQAAAGSSTTTGDDDHKSKRRASKKLHKKRPEDMHHSGPSATMELPERLKSHDDSSEEDVVAPANGTMFMNMNQSIFGLIAAAGSRVDFHNRFDGQSSDEDEGDGDDSERSERAPRRAKTDAAISKTTVLKKPSISSPVESSFGRHRRQLSTHKLLRSLPSLPGRLSRSKSKKEKEHSKLAVPPEESIITTDTSESATPAMELEEEEEEEEEAKLAPVMSRMLEARQEMSSRPSFDLERQSTERTRESSVEEGPTLLAKKLMEIFEFDEPEMVVEEYPCWLLQSVLLQGFMYITSRHICFYAYLPKKAHDAAKSGYLSKSGKRSPKYNRFWFRLKGDVLSYYHDAANLYFPHGQIDLRYGISCSITDKEKGGQHFSIVMPKRTYHFRADSDASAKEWVRSIQRVIFRSHNDGDSVKISLPIDNVIEVEETQMIEFAETCKIRVFDNDETFAIDEYYFSFFSFGKAAINVLKILTEDTRLKQEAVGSKVVDETHVGSQKRAESVGRQSPAPERPRLGKLPEPVRATLSPLSPHSPLGQSPRPSLEVHSRNSMDMFRPFGRRSMDLARREESPRRSFSGGHRSLSRPSHGARKVPEKQSSSDSYVQSSMEDPSYSGMAASSNEDPSASQILAGSEVFQSPTIRRSVSAAHASPKLREAQLEAAMRTPLVPPSSWKPQHAATTGHLADPGAGEKTASGAAPSLQSIAKMGAYPLQRATAFAEYLSKNSRRMGSFLSVEPMGYVEKVSGMWKGGHKHYEGGPGSLKTDDEEVDEDGDGKHAKSVERFRAHFALPETERLMATYYGYIFRVLPLYGKIYLSDSHFCFRSLMPGTRTKLILPLKDIETVEKEKGFRLGWEGMVIVVRGSEELFFEFGKTEVRDDCATTLFQTIETARYLKESGILHQEAHEEAMTYKAESDALREARQGEYPTHEHKRPKKKPSLSNLPPILFDDAKASFCQMKPAGSLKITCLTIGSRGDVQPYIALCKGLLAEGHKPTIATHKEFQGWIESHGIGFAQVGGDPAELMRLVIEYGTFTIGFLKVANSMFRGWLDDLLASAWTACQGADVLIESPSAMAGIHIAEALEIPYFRAFTMPWTRTRAYPHAFVMPEYKMGGAYNYLSYVMFDNIFWKAIAGQVNRWRNSMLSLPNTNLDKMAQNKVPFLYNFSPAVVAPPLDFSDWIRVTGYWFLDEGAEKDWTPPADLQAFIDKARKDDKKLVYVGFGSIIVNDTAKMTQEVIDAVTKADVRCILSKGWSDRVTGAGAKDKDKDKNGAADATTEAKPPAKEEPKIPDSIFVIKSAPHDWLFKQIDAAAHHGGSGTTGASLRAGIPTIIRPFFGDQFFFGSRVEDIGVGLCLKKWGANSFARALWEATHNERMIVKARVLGEQIRKDTGVETAIQCLYRDMEYAKSLIRRKTGKNAREDGDEGDEGDEEESWTFVGGDEPDPDLVTKRLSDGLGTPSGAGTGQASAAAPVGSVAAAPVAAGVALGTAGPR